jgi:phosphoribosyl-ATP pyrophosphohydrolase
MKNQLNLTELLAIVQSKINSQDEKSYIKNLCLKGIEHVAQKVGEESVEVVIASLLYQQHLLNNSSESAKYRQDMVQFRQNLVNEFCDLFFHSLILMEQNKITFEDIFTEFFKRNQK